MGKLAAVLSRIFLVYALVLSHSVAQANWRSAIQCNHNGHFFRNEPGRNFTIFDVKNRRELPSTRLHEEFRNNAGKESYIYTSPNGRYAVYIRNESALNASGITHAVRY